MTTTAVLCCCGCHTTLPFPPAIWRVTAACIHEHLWVLDFCARCFTDERIADEPRSCGDCWDERHAEDPETGMLVPIGVGPLSHDCPMGTPVIERIAAEDGEP